MQKLAKVITPFHKDLRIPKVYHYECPWPAAQTHIYMINVYKVGGFKDVLSEQANDWSVVAITECQRLQYSPDVVLSCRNSSYYVGY